MFRRTQDPLRRERSFDYRAVTSYGGPFQTSSSTSFLCNSVQSVLQPQEASLLVWANPVSLAATQGIAFAFSSSGYLDVSVPRVCLLISYEFRYGYHSITSGGFPHSEISGSKLAYSSPKHIGVRPVLHRLLVPRHPGRQPNCLDADIQYRAYPILLRPPIAQMVRRWYRNINLLSIAYAFRPRLRSRLTLSGRAFLRKP